MGNLSAVVEALHMHMNQFLVLYVEHLNVGHRWLLTSESFVIYRGGHEKGQLVLEPVAYWRLGA